MSDQAQPVFQIQRIYLKDLSLEQPNSPDIFLEQDAPEIEVGLDVETKKIVDSFYEVEVMARITAKIKDKIAFLVEGKQAGIFEISGVPDDQMPLLLNIGGPNIVYPHLRANIADAITRGGFPPVHLSEINFELLYQQRQEAATNKSAQKTT